MALESSPELANLDEAIAAQERAGTAAHRAFWLPSLALQGTIGTDDTSGAGSEGLATGGEEGAPSPFAVEPPDDLDWSVALNASIPLWTSGERSAELRRARVELDRLLREREALAERIEQRVRIAVHRAGASRASIGLTRDAAEAADKSLDLVTDSYSMGTGSVLDLLDAQNAALVADQLAATAYYDFLVDLISARRAAGTIDLIYVEANGGISFYDRMDAYYQQRGWNP